MQATVAGINAFKIIKQIQIQRLFLYHKTRLESGAFIFFMVSLLPKKDLGSRTYLLFGLCGINVVNQLFKHYQNR